MRLDRAAITGGTCRRTVGVEVARGQLLRLFAGFVATAFVLLAAASGASASKVVIDAVENPMPVLDQATKGGKFNGFSVTALAVNDAGTGGAGVGDFYVVDSGNSRVQRFSASGEFKELWGMDVVETGTENGTAIQSLTVDATAGQFKLTFGADTTSDLPFDATASQVQTALQNLSSIGSGNVRVTGGTGGAVPYGIVFTGSLAGSAQSPIVASSGTTPLSGGAASATVRVLNAGGDAGGFEICRASQACKAGNFSMQAGGFFMPYGVAVQQSTGNVFVTNKGAQRVDVFTANGIFVRSFGLDVVSAGKAGDAPAQSAEQALTVKATGGTFKLTFQGNTTPDLDYDASAAEVQAALQELGSVGPQGVTVSGGPGDAAGTAPYVLSFGGGLANSPQPLIAAANGSTPLSGGAATAEVAATQAGRTGLEVCVDPADCQSGSSGSVGGALAGPAGITFAPPGAPNAGNVLVTEEQNSRVSEFTPGGAFVRAFGYGVVNVGPSKTSGTSSDVQRLKIAAGSGTFTLTFEGQTTASLPYDATSEEVRSALNALSAIGGRSGSVAVTGGPGDANGSNPFTISFGGALAGRAVGAISVDSSGLGLGVGAEASCSTIPTAPDGVTYQWLRNGVAIPGATASTYTFAAADQGKGIQCQVIARYGNVFVTQMTTAYVVSPVPATALPTAPEFFSINASGNLDGSADRDLSCDASSWGNAPTEYTYQFLKGGKPIGAPVTTASTSHEITITAGEQQVATTFQCVVTATNAGGSVSSASYTLHTTPQATPTPGMQFPTGSAFSTVTSVSSGAPGFETCLAAAFDTCQGGVSGTGEGQFTVPTKIAEDPTGNVYVGAESFFPADFRMQYFTQSGGSLTPEGLFAPSVLKGNDYNYHPAEVAIGPNGHVFVNQLYKKDELPPCIDVEASPEVLTHEFDSSGNLIDTHLRCSNNSGGGGIFAFVGSRALAVNAVTGRLFFLLDVPAVLIADEADGPTATVTAATEVRATSATLNAEIKPLKGPWNTYYHFETRPVGGTAWERQPGVVPLDPVIGNGTGNGSAKGCPNGNPPMCEVSFTAGGLRPSTEYEVRVMAYTWKGLNVSTSTIGWTFGGYQRSDGPTFTTVPSGPTAVTGGANWSSPAATKPSLDLEGQVNAANRRTTVVFEYVTEEQFEASGWANAASAPKAPARPVEAGRNYVNVAVRQSVANLDPSKTYRYRLTATNDNGTDYGAAKTVAPPRDDARYLELISNADGEGMGAAAGFSTPFLAVSQDGKRVFFSSQSIGAPVSLSGLNTPFGGDRGPDGWSVFQVGADPNRALGNLLPGDYLVSSNLSGVLWEGFDAETRERRAPFFSFTPAGGKNELITQLQPRQISPATATTMQLVAGSPDFDTFTFLGFAAETYLPGEKPTYFGGGNGQYYQVTGARSGNPQLSLVNQDNNGVQIGGACAPLPGGGFNAGGEITQSSSVSASGDVVYFLANEGANGDCNFSETLEHRPRLFKRVNAENTVAVSAPTCTPTPLCGGPNAADMFRGASLDGSVVVFKTDRRVTESDKDSTNDVYLYDETPPAGQPKLVQISAGEAVSPEHPTSGTGASTQGVVKISTDGSRVYFVATGRLTTDATEGANNLYVYQRDAAHPAGQLKFLANFDSGSSELWTLSGAAVTAVPVHGNSGDDGKWGDGRMLIFSTPEKLLPEDTDSQSDVYRIDSEATSNAIVCMSCAGNGAFPVEARGQDAFARPFWNAPQIASDDGKVVVFWTKEGLIPEDTNGGLDVYAWEDGDLNLVTTKAIPDVKPIPSSGTIGDGSVIYLYSAASYVPSDQNSANDVYAARTGGGFPTAEETFFTCLSGEECKAPATPVAAPENPGSASFVGPDNPPVKEEKACKKGQVRKNGKCVKKPPVKCKKGQVRKGGKCVKKKPSKKANRAAGSSQKGGRK